MADGGDGNNVVFMQAPPQNNQWVNGPVEIAEPLDYPNEGPAPKPPSPAAQILMQAALLIDGERDHQHGDRKACHTQIARLWTAYLGTKVDPVDVAAMMILVKLGRTQTGNPNPDTWIDICGYGAIAGELTADVPRP